MDEACVNEVVDLHRFIERWLTGAVPATGEAFERMPSVLADGFVIVSPGGVITAREALLNEFHAAHGSRPEGFTVRIDDLRIRRNMGDLCVATYEEWHRDGREETARIATALFGPRDETPNGVEWLHLHETWKAGRGPATS